MPGSSSPKVHARPIWDNTSGWSWFWGSLANGQFLTFTDSHVSICCFVFQKTVGANDRARQQSFPTCVVNESWHRVHCHAIQGLTNLDRATVLSIDGIGTFDLLLSVLPFGQVWPPPSIVRTSRGAWRRGFSLESAANQHGSQTDAGSRWLWMASLCLGHDSWLWMPQWCALSELAGPRRRARLVVLGIEVGGRMSTETTSIQTRNCTPEKTRPC